MAETVKTNSQPSTSYSTPYIMGSISMLNRTFELAANEFLFDSNTL